MACHKKKISLLGFGHSSSSLLLLATVLLTFVGVLPTNPDMDIYMQNCTISFDTPEHVSNLLDSFAHVYDTDEAESGEICPPLPPRISPYMRISP